MKFLSSLLVSMLFVSLVPVTVLAAPSVDDPDGSFENPFEISTCEELQAISSDEDYVYSLTGNIDCSETVEWNEGAGFIPIEYFDGALMGNGYTISDLYINLPEVYQVGFIGYLGGILANITFADLDITGDTEVGLIGRQVSESVLVDVKVTNGQITGETYVGGLSGMINYGHLFNSSFEGDVVSGNFGGGLIGYIASSADVHDNYFEGTVTANDAAGLIGYIDGLTLPIYNNYVTGTITGANYAAGMVGQLTNAQMLFENNFSNAILTGTGVNGGLAGSVVGDYTDIQIDNYYFDLNNAGLTSCNAVLISGTFDSDGCTTWDSSVDTDYLISNNTDLPVSNWDFEGIWQTSEGFPVHQRILEYTAPSVPLNIEGEISNLVEAVFTFDESADLGNLPLIEYNYQIQYDGENWEYPFEDDYVWHTDPREIIEYLPFRGLDYVIRVNAENILGASDWVEYEFSSGSVAEDEITTCEDLRDIDLAAENYEYTFNLTQDIDCTGVEFESIGGADAWSVFTGVLDGNNYTISNLTIVDEDGYAGLFEEFSEAVVKDLNFENLSVTGVSSTGGLVGQMDDAYIQNVSIEGDVTSSGEAGGVIGRMDDDYYVFLSEVTFNGNVVGDSNVGGIIGQFYLEEEGAMHLQKLASHGTVVATGDNVGGLIGDVDLYADDDDSIVRILESYSTSTVEGVNSVGGFAGDVHVVGEDDMDFYVEDSFASGDVTGVDSVGGFIGYAESEYDDDDSTISLDRVYASGDATGTTNVGGLIGFVEAPDDSDEHFYLYNTFATGLVTATSNTGGLVGYMTDTLDEEDELNNYYAASTGQEVCDLEEYLVSCTLVEDISDFYDSMNEPFTTGDWDSEEVWLFEGDVLPVLVWDDFRFEPEEEAPSSGGSSSGSRVGVGGGKTETSSDSTYTAEVKEVLDNGVVTENPDFSTNKCEALVMMARVFKWEVGTDTNDIYTDTPEWCGAYAKFGTERGIVEGRTPTTLGMETPVTRYEIAVMLYRELKIRDWKFEGKNEVNFTDELVPWAKEAVETLAKEGIINGFANGTFGGEKNILKQDLGVMLLRI